MIARKEFGSFFHWDSSVFNVDSWVAPGVQLYGSGRDALIALVTYGVSIGWRRLFLPSYYCHEVTESIRPLIDVQIYACNFLTPAVSVHLGETDALVAVEYFGRRSTVRVSGGTLILDVTHFPVTRWEYAREPDYVFGSLRKVCFVPDGGFLQPKRSNECIDTPSLAEVHAHACAIMLQAMAMKAAYLQGANIEKETYLELASDAESLFGRAKVASAPSALSGSLLPNFDLMGALKRRAENCQFLRKQIAYEAGDFEILESDAYLVVLCPDREAKLKARAHLVSHDIYPMTLWPTSAEFFTAEDVALGDRVLMVHCDSRYSPEDMQYIASVLLSDVDGKNAG